MSEPLAGYDAETLAFYEREAAAYTSQPETGRHTRLRRFLEGLPPGSSILELGSGGGRDAAEMIRLGFKVTATDGSPAMAAIAEQRLGQPVRVMRFEQLDADGAYDAVWANASLLHARAGALPDILGRVWRALQPGGRFYASFKLGKGEDRDSLGRYYNFPPEAALRDAYAAAGSWASLAVDHAAGAGYDGVARDWAMITAARS